MNCLLTIVASLLLCAICSAQNIMPPVDTNTVQIVTMLQSPKAATSNIPGTQAMALPVVQIEYVHTLIWEPNIDCIVEQSSNLTDWQEIRRFQVQIVCPVTNTEPSMFWRVANDFHGTNEPLSSFLTITN